jgi:peptide/nickel transport system substrate-binding protein
MSRRGMFVVAAMVLIIGLSFPQIGQSAATPATKVQIAVGQEPASLDVSQETGGDTVTVLGNINETLIDRATDGKLIPSLASSWKVSPDGKVIEFTLRKGVKFHNGDPLTVKDVLFSFERAVAKNRVMPSRLKPVEKIEALDESRIRFLWKTPDVTFIPKLAAGVMIVSKSYYDRVGEDVFTRKPVGTGPYKFVRYEMGQYIDIERFEDRQASSRRSGADSGGPLQSG